MADQQEPGEGYTGPATLTVEGRDIAVRVVLDARHEPLDGRLHWFGRLRLPEGTAAAEPELLRAMTAPASRVELSTPGGRAAAGVGDVDLWGRYRVTGTGRPPYELESPRDLS